MRPKAGVALAAFLLALGAGCGADEPGPVGGEASTVETGGTETVTGPTTTEEVDFDRADLADARARWAALGLESYRVVVRRSCFCPPEYLGPFVVTVEGGNVEKVVLGEGAAAETPPPDILELALTVDDVFDSIEDALAQGGTAEVEYDEETGVPIRAALDPILDAVDDETLYELELLDGP